MPTEMVMGNYVVPGSHLEDPAKLRTGEELEPTCSLWTSLNWDGGGMFVGYV
jgi:hypothetical protein